MRPSNNSPQPHRAPSRHWSSSSRGENQGSREQQLLRCWPQDPAPSQPYTRCLSVPIFRRELTKALRRRGLAPLLGGGGHLTPTPSGGSCPQPSPPFRDPDPDVAPPGGLGNTPDSACPKPASRQALQGLPAWGGKSSGSEPYGPGSKRSSPALPLGDWSCVSVLHDSDKSVETLRTQ